MFDWRKIIFSLSVTLLFIPMVYLGVNTFFPTFDDYNLCYEKSPRLDNCFNFQDNKTKYDNCIQEQDNNSEETRKCMKEYQDQRTKHNGSKFTTIMIICLIASFAMLNRKLEKSVIYGLFLGIVITAFSASMTYMESRSLIGFILLVILFILIIFFIQRNRSKD